MTRTPTFMFLLAASKSARSSTVSAYDKKKEKALSKFKKKWSRQRLTYWKYLKK